MAGRFEGWSALHPGAAPTGVVGGWLRFVYRLASPLVRLRVPPNAITLAGLVLGALALIPAAAGARWPLLAAGLIGLSALFDGLDGAVAVLSSRVSPFGARLDHFCDRTTELCFAGCLWLAGGPWLGCLAGALLALLHEGLRSWARHRGMDSIGAITVSERPTRVLVSAMFVLAAGVYPASAELWTFVGAMVLAAAGAIGLGQLVFVVRRSLG